MPDTMIDGVQIHYNETGEGEPLLLIMGYGMPGDAWLGSLPFLNAYWLLAPSALRRTTVLVVQAAENRDLFDRSVGRRRCRWPVGNPLADALVRPGRVEVRAVDAEGGAQVPLA